MKITVPERIVALKGMISRLERPELVEKELQSIFEDAKYIEDEITQTKVLTLLFEICMDLNVYKKRLDNTKENKKTTSCVNIEVVEYKDVIVVTIDEKIPYKELLKIIIKVNEKFNTKYIEFLGYSEVEEAILIGFKQNTQKDILIKISEWNLNHESIEIYTEGFVEYLKK